MPRRRRNIPQQADWRKMAETTMVKSMTDAERLDWLEKMAFNPGGILLHSEVTPTGRIGLGLRFGTRDRTLREAIDQANGQA